MYSLKVLRRWVVAVLILNHGYVFGLVCSNTTGINTCKLITECPSALENLQKHILPKTCGFMGRAPMVCCSEDVTVTVYSSRGLKSLQKCIEYNDVNSDTERTKREVVREVELLDNSRQHISSGTPVKLTLGNPLRDHPFTHMAAIGYDNNDGNKTYLCAGSLISENFVLSAAHCATTRDYGPAKYARLGDLNLRNSSDDANVQERKITEIIIHHSYKPPSTYNDICLFKLEKNIVISPHVRPICLQTAKRVDASAVYTAGWGQTEELSPPSDALLMIEIAIIDHEKCKEIFKINSRRLRNGIDDEVQICAGSTESKDACKGDSGGPLQVQSKDFLLHHTLVGITSFGRNCGLEKTATAYARVSHYIEWIESYVWR